MGSEIHRKNHPSWPIIGRLRVHHATFKSATVRLEVRPETRPRDLGVRWSRSKEPPSTGLSVFNIRAGRSAEACLGVPACGEWRAGGGPHEPQSGACRASLGHPRGMKIRRQRRPPGHDPLTDPPRLGQRPLELGD